MLAAGRPRQLGGHPAEPALPAQTADKGSDVHYRADEARHESGGADCDVVRLHALAGHNEVEGGLVCTGDEKSVGDSEFMCLYGIHHPRCECRSVCARVCRVITVLGCFLSCEVDCCLTPKTGRWVPPHAPKSLEIQEMAAAPPKPRFCLPVQPISQPVTLSAAKESFKRLLERLALSPRKTDVGNFVDWVKNLFPDRDEDGTGRRRPLSQRMALAYARRGGGPNP